MYKDAIRFYFKIMGCLIIVFGAPLLAICGVGYVLELVNYNPFAIFGVAFFLIAAWIAWLVYLVRQYVTAEGNDD